MQSIDEAFRLINKGINFEEDAYKAKQHNDIDNFIHLREYASQHYSSAGKLLLSTKINGKSNKILGDIVEFLVLRLEKIRTEQNLLLQHQELVIDMVVDPVKDEKRKKVAIEIFETEKTYCFNLHNLIEFYMVPMRAQDILSEDEELIVFAGCTQIAGLSEQMLFSFSKKIEEWDPDKTTLGDVFSLYSEFLKMYIPFSSNFTQGQRILQNKHFNKIIQTANAAAIPSIDSLRILPIQRIPRFVLLVTELLKHTREGHPDCSKLEKALADIQIVAKHVNARMTASEMEAKVLEIQSNLWAATGSVPELVAPGRTFVKEGPVAKVGVNGKLKRNYYLFCFNDLVVYATTNSLFRSKYHFHKALDYYGAFNADDEVRQLGVSMKYGECAFKITGSNGYRIFVVSNDAERRQWLKALTDLAGVKEEKRKSWGRARGELLDDDDDDDLDIDD